MSSIRQAIIEHLNKKGNYDPDVDDLNIDIIIENLEFIKEMKKLMKKEGIIILDRSGNNVVIRKINPAYNVYQSCIRNIHNSCAKLSISRNERLKLKLIEEKEKDDFDEDFG